MKKEIYIEASSIYNKINVVSVFNTLAMEMFILEIEILIFSMDQVVTSEFLE
jgi:hypothetical protein